MFLYSSPLVGVAIGPSRSDPRAVGSAGRPVPLAAGRRAWLDTGAETTCMDQAATPLGLPVRALAFVNRSGLLTPATP